MKLQEPYFCETFCCLSGSLLLNMSALSLNEVLINSAINTLFIYLAVLGLCLLVVGATLVAGRGRSLQWLMNWTQARHGLQLPTRLPDSEHRLRSCGSPAELLRSVMGSPDQG